MDTGHNKGDIPVHSYLFPRIKEEEDMDSSYTDNSGQDLSAHSDVFEHVKTEDSSNSYGSVKEERDLRKRGDLVYDPDTLLCIRRIDDADLTTDEDSEVKEPRVSLSSAKEGHLKTGSTSGIADKVVRRRPRFTASEEFVLVTEMLEHYDRLFGERARITPFSQKVLIWQKVLDNVNSVGVVQRGIEEAKKHWHLYRHKLMEKLASIRKHGSDAGRPLFLQLTPLESKVATLFKLEYMLRSPEFVFENQGAIDMAGVCAQNGSSTGDQVLGGLGQGDYSHSKAPRNVKFSFDENCALVHEAVGVWDCIIGKNAATTSQVRKNHIWSKIVEAVNAAGTQPRSIENCKKRLRDIKRRVKAKMADQHKYFQRNGGGPALELQYLSYEEELMHVLGPDTIRPVDGHVDTDREPYAFSHPLPAAMGISSFGSVGQKSDGKSEPDETCDDEEFWNHLSFDMAEEDEEDDKETAIKAEPIDYSTESKPSPEPQHPVVAQPTSTQLSVPFASLPSSNKPFVMSSKAAFFPSKCPTAVAKPLPTPTKPPSASNKPLPFPVKPPLSTQQCSSYSGATPGYQPSYPGAIPGYQPSNPGPTPGYQSSNPGPTPGYQSSNPGPTPGYQSSNPGPTPGYQSSNPGPTPGYQSSNPGPTPGYQPSNPGPTPGYQPCYPGATPGYQPNTTNTESINKVVGTFHSAQHNYHRSQRLQMHVIHMDLLHLGSGLQKLTRNIKVNNHVRATSTSKEFRLKQKDVEDQRQYRQEKLHLLRKHHEAKQKLLQQHFDKKERLMEENNQILQKILQRLSTATGLTSPLKAASEEDVHCLSSSLPPYDGPSSLPYNSVRTHSHRGVRKRGGKGRGGT